MRPGQPQQPRSRPHTFGVAVGSPLLVIETIFYTAGELPAGWRSAVHQAENFKYKFTTSR